jgi:DNA replication protein DnaC
MTTTPAIIPKTVVPPSVSELPADLDARLRRLKMATIRRTAPEVLLTAKTQLWTPEEVLRTLVESELAARDASNVVNRLKVAGFPVTKTLESFDVAASSIQPKVFDYLSSLEWIRAQHNLAVIRPAGTGKSHTLIGLGVAAIHAGDKVRYFTAADLVETLHRGPADNTVGKIIESLLRVDLIILDELGFAPLDDTGTQLLFRLVAGAYKRRSLAIGSHWPFQEMGPIPARADHRRQHPRPAPAPCHRRHHRRPVLPHERRPTPKGEPTTNIEITARGGYFYLATSGYFNLAIDRRYAEVLCLDHYLEVLKA